MVTAQQHEANQWKTCFPFFKNLSNSITKLKRERLQSTTDSGTRQPQEQWQDPRPEKKWCTICSYMWKDWRFWLWQCFNITFEHWLTGLMLNYSVHTTGQINSVLAKQRPEMESVALNSILLVNSGTRALHYTLEIILLRTGWTCCHLTFVPLRCTLLPKSPCNPRPLHTTIQLHNNKTSTYRFRNTWNLNFHNICKITQQTVHLSFQAPTVISFQENSLYSIGFHIYTYREGSESFVFWHLSQQ